MDNACTEGLTYSYLRTQYGPWTGKSGEKQLSAVSYSFKPSDDLVKKCKNVLAELSQSPKQ